MAPAGRGHLPEFEPAADGAPGDMQTAVETELVQRLRDKTLEVERLRRELTDLQTLLQQERLRQQQQTRLTADDVACALPGSGTSSPREAELRFPADCGREIFDKVPGTSDDSGHLFEVKMVLLLFLRCLGTGKSFRIASNLRGAGRFDDVVVEQDGHPSRVCVQLKHRETPIRPAEVLAYSGKFSVLNYFVSYRDDMAEQYAEDCQLVFHTNADVPRELCHPTKERDLLSTSENGLCFVFSRDDVDVYDIPRKLQLFRQFLLELDRKAEESSEEDLAHLVESEIAEFHPLKSVMPFAQKLMKLKNDPTRKQIEFLLEKIKNLGDMSGFHNFLQKFKVYYRQANVRRMDDVIKDELRKQVGIKDCDAMVTKLLERIKVWWKSKEAYYLTVNDRIWVDTVREMFYTLSEGKLNELTEMQIRVKEDCLDEFRNAIGSYKVFHILVDGDHTSLAACKVKQVLDGGELLPACVFLGLQTAVAKQESVFGAWCSRWGGLLVLEAETTRPLQAMEEFLSGLSTALRDHRHTRLVVITDVNDLAATGHFRALEGVACVEWSDRTRVTDLTKDVKGRLLDSKVAFQGYSVTLKALIGRSEELLRAVDEDMLLRLVRNETVSLGNDLIEPIEHYIPRTLTRGGKCYFAQSHDDIEGRAVVVIGEPGMGKSTLLTYLAKQIKHGDPAMWVVRVNLGELTSYFDKVEKCVNDKGIITFLKTVVNLETANRSSLDERLFNHCWQTTGRMALLLDGFDEICPTYEAMVSLYLKNVILTGIKSIWVTSRNICKEVVEKTVKTEAYCLEAFKEEDQRSFLKKVWSKRFGSLPKDVLDVFITKTLSLVSSSLNDVEKSFMGIPLQTMFIAEMFGRNLKEFEKTQFYGLPTSFDILELYEEFFKKKCAIDLEDKRGYDMTKKGVREDCLSLSTKAEEIHKLCALVTLLSPVDLRRIHDSSVTSKVNSFLAGLQRGIDLIGVVHSVLDGKPVFIHRTFAEYFLAKWFSEHYNENRNLMIELVHNATFYMVFRILNRILAKGFKLHMAVVNNDMTAFKGLLESEDVDARDRGGRTALHLAAGFVRDETFSRLLLERDARVDLSDNVLQWNALLYADATGMWGSIEEILVSNKGYATDLIFTMENIRNEKYIKSAVRTSCKNGFEKCLEFFVKQGVSANLALDEEMNRPLHVAAGFGEVSQRYLDVGSKTTRILDLLLKSGADVNARTVRGKTPLHLVAEGGKLALVIFFVEREMDEMWAGKRSVTRRLFDVLKGERDHVILQKVMTQFRDVDGRTALDVAAASGNDQVVRYLTNSTLSVDGFLRGHNGKVDDPQLLSAVRYMVEEMKADVFAADEYSDTPLHHAARKGDVSLVDYFVKSGASTVSQNKHGDTPLHVAASQGKLDVVKHLVLACRCSPNSLGRNNLTPFQHALSGDHIDVARALVAMGARTDLRHRSGDTALNEMARLGKISAVTYLLEECGESAYGRGHLDRTPLHDACAGGHLLVAQYLRDKGARTDAKDVHGDTVLHAAADAGRLHAAVYLIEECGVDPDARGRFMDTALHRACVGGHLPLVRYLTRGGRCDVQLRDGVGDLPIHHAVLARKYDVVSYLLAEFCYNRNCTGARGRTPLHVACTIGDLDMVMYLLEECDAGTGILNADKETALDLAKKYNYKVIVHYLRFRVKPQNKKSGNVKQLKR